MSDFIDHCGDGIQLRIAISKDGVAYDLSAAQALEWRAYDRDSNAALLSLTLAGGGIAIEGDDNEIAVVTINKTQTAALGPGVFGHALRVTDAAGIPDTARDATFELLANRFA